MITRTLSGPFFLPRLKSSILFCNDWSKFFGAAIASPLVIMTIKRTINVRLICLRIFVNVPDIFRFPAPLSAALGKPLGESRRSKRGNQRKDSMTSTAKYLFHSILLVTTSRICCSRRWSKECFQQNGGDVKRRITPAWSRSVYLSTPSRFHVTARVFDSGRRGRFVLRSATSKHIRRPAGAFGI